MTVVITVLPKSLLIQTMILTFGTVVVVCHSRLSNTDNSLMLSGMQGCCSAVLVKYKIMCMTLPDVRGCSLRFVDTKTALCLSCILAPVPPVVQSLTLHLTQHCRLTHLRKLGLVPKRGEQVKSRAEKVGLEPAAHLELEHSEGARSGLGPLPPWPTPLQLRQALAEWGRAQAAENAQVLAQR